LPIPSEAPVITVAFEESDIVNKSCQHATFQLLAIDN
jgi:hypothetical protein